MFGHIHDITRKRSRNEPFREVISSAQTFGELAAVLRIFVNTKLEVLAEGLVELVEVDLVFRYKIESLLDEVLANDLKNLVLLQGFARYVKGKIGVDYTVDEVEILADEIFGRP